MTQSKTIKDQAAAAKRTATAIRNIVAQSDRDKGKDKRGLAASERATLLKAASILGGLGATKSVDARKALSAETAKEKRITEGAAEARAIMAQWPTCTTVLDKVAFIAGVDQIHALQHYLREGLPIYGGRATVPEDWRVILEYIYADAQTELASAAARHFASTGKPVSEIMATAASHAETFKQRQNIIAVAKEWEIRLA